jgi:GxxExxY protein
MREILSKTRSQGVEGVVEHKAITGKVIGCAMAVHRALGPGFLESVYQNALVHELRKAGRSVEVRCPIQVRYDGVVVGAFVCDLLVDGAVLVENKAVQALAPVHEVQLVNYLTATGIEVGLLLNFGAQRLEYRRKTRTYRPPSGAGSETD